MRFRGIFWFLSNMCPNSLGYCVEVEYQKAKCTDPADQARFVGVTNGFIAKKIGKTVRLRPDWDQVKLQIMEDLVSKKFSDPVFMAKLQAIKGEIVEENWWGDQFWGVSNGVGLNHLGRILMKIRDSA